MDIKLIELLEVTAATAIIVYLILWLTHGKHDGGKHD